jgi:N-acetylglucosaminyl-diphospho-decaprenol L-rhamnosyltransferase
MTYRLRIGGSVDSKRLSPDLDIVIVNWNAGAQLRDCLASVAGASRDGFALGRVVVVDNGSRDGSLAGVDTHGLPVAVIANPGNRGFGAASNQGAAGGTSDYILFLNPDVRVERDSIAAAIRFLEEPANARVGLCGIQLVDAEGRVHRSCTRHPKPSDFVAKMTGLSEISPRLFPTHVMSEWDHTGDRVVDHVMGAFLMVRREAFTALAGFDERFFVYLEDLDLSLRANRVGWTTMFLARARAFHRSGGVSEQAKAARLYYSLHSRMLYGHKHFAAPVAWLLDVGTLVVEPLVRFFGLVLTRRGRELRETARGFAELWTSVLTGRGPVETAGV